MPLTLANTKGIFIFFLTCKVTSGHLQTQKKPRWMTVTFQQDRG